jgi:hypothetical protein
MADQPEVWLRGPVPEIPAALQPVAHALVQAREDVAALVATMPASVLWRRAGAASAGFHLLHLAGALDRLFTYARGEALTDEQRTAARDEAQDHSDMDGPALLARVSTAIDRALDQLRGTNPSALFGERRGPHGVVQYARHPHARGGTHDPPRRAVCHDGQDSEHGPSSFLL